jgi:hypothetical protein
MQEAGYKATKDELFTLNKHWWAKHEWIAYDAKLGTKFGTIRQAKTRGKSRLSLAESLKFS